MARELAAHTKSLTGITAPAFRTIERNVNQDRCLLPYDSDQLESFTAEVLHEQMHRVSDDLEPPEFGSEFHLFHCMTSDNVILSGMDEPRTEGESHVHVAGLVSWGYASFYPTFWITTFSTIPTPVYSLGVT